MCLLCDNDARQFFMYVKTGGGTGGWITADPNSVPSGGRAYGVTGDVAPLFCTYYSGVVAKLRTPAEFTESGVCPAGVTMGWYT